MEDDRVVDLLNRAKAYEPPDPDPEDWMALFELTDEEIAEMEDAEFIIPGLFISSQVTIIASKPGRGKTSILTHEASNAVLAGFRVMYVNMDCGAGDVKYWHEQARTGGFKMITPHFKGSEGINQWVNGLVRMADGKTDLSKLIIMVDTLKKIADMMSKTRVKAIMGLLRALSAQGATAVCAAHCNKHRTPDGKLVFEGTGDIEADCDNLIYLESEKDEFGVRTVSSEPSDKVRGIFVKRSWRINPDRTVESLGEFIDVKGKIEAQTKFEKDATVIQVIKEGICSGKHKRVELHEYCTEHKISRRAFDAVIKRYCQGHTPAKVAPIWWNQKQIKDNADYYILIEGGG